MILGQFRSWNKGKALYLRTFNHIFFQLFKQGDSHFQFALGATIYTATSVTQRVHLRFLLLKKLEQRDPVFGDRQITKLGKKKEN